MSSTENAVLAKNFFYKMFRNSSNSVDMNVNGSSTPVDFTVTAPLSGSLKLTRINLIIIDGGMGYGEFGGLGSVLSNGVEMKIFDADDNLILDFTDGEDIIANGEFGLLSGGDSIIHPVAGDDFSPIRFTIEKAGHPMLLSGGEYIRIRIQDNLTNLYKFQGMAQGTIW